MCSLALTPGTPDLEVWGSSLARLIVFLDKKLYSTLSLFTQVYKLVSKNILLGGSPTMDLHPIQGRVAILLGMLHAKETGISIQLLDLLARVRPHLYLISIVEVRVRIPASLNVFRLSFCSFFTCHV